MEGEWTTHMRGGLHTLGGRALQPATGPWGKRITIKINTYPLPLASQLWAPEKEKLFSFPIPPSITL